MKNSVVALAFVAMASLSATTVFAGSDLRDPEVMTDTVSLKKVDFSDPAQVNKLYDRLSKSARTVCDSDLRAVPYTGAEDRMCARKSLEEAVRNIGDERLSQVHASRGSWTGATATASLDAHK